MTADSTPLYKDCASSLTAIVEGTFGAIDTLSRSFADIVGDAHSGSISTTDLGALDERIDAVLSVHAGLLGMGVVVCPGVLDDAERFLQWRQRQDDGSLAPLILDVGNDVEDPYDYPEMEWFRVPADEGRRMVGGPYFDYRGNERYTLTYAEPVIRDGVFWGIAGADQTVAELESQVLPVLRRIPVRAGLLNHERRVVTANSPLLATGQKVSKAEVEAAEQFVVVEDLGWTLVVITPK